jgi:branched-chain amino acid transport system substrate-binding protein
MIMTKRIIIAVIILLVVLLIGWQAYQSSQGGNTIKIGAVLSLTGDAAKNGESEQKGIEMAVNEINAAGGVAGKKLQVIFEDDQTDPKSTVSAVTKLISIDQVPVIIGPTWDFLTNAAVPIINQNKVVAITASTLPDTITATSSYLFETHAPVAVIQPAAEKFLSQFHKPRVVLITINNPWGMAYLRVFEAAAHAQGATVLKEVVLPSFDDNDIQGQLTLLQPLHPDALLTALNFDDSVTFMKRRQAFGMTMPILAEEKTEDLYKNGNVSADLLGGVFVDRFSSPNETFINAYQKIYGAPPQEYADTAYDAAYVIKAAIENAGGNYSADAIRQGIKEVTNYNGASGKIDFTQNSYPENETAVLDKFINGQFQPVNN